MNRDMLAVELFAGAGGLSIGLERAGFRIALANEIESDFAKTFSQNHPNAVMLQQDIQEVDFAKELSNLGISEIALLSGGPPCQGFSTVGSKNELDPRNSLFYEFIRAVDEISPRFVLFENVSGFKRMYEGVAYKTLLGELDSLGYATTSAVLEASDFGLPQVRARTLVVGWKKELPPVALPTPTHSDERGLFPLTPKLTLMGAISDLPPLGVGGCSSAYAGPPRNEFQQRLRGDNDLLTEHNASNYGLKMQEILRTVPPGGSVEDLPMRLRPRSYFSNTYARLIPDRPSPTITRNFGTPSSSRCIHPFQDRALSTREGARLQGFPDDYRFWGSKISKNLQIGNAVPPIFGEIVAREIMKSLHAASHLASRVAS